MNPTIRQGVIYDVSQGLDNVTESVANETKILQMPQDDYIKALYT